ncbi:hypothetical protein HK101_003140 [Irineochytrium annulatum]|nr:hypothetical protein HK101_003140 [Irineochytrium annulatum]
MPSPRIEPVRTVPSLNDWQPGADPFNVSSVPLRPRSTSPQHRLLVCHDFKGGYHEDALPQGVKGPAASTRDVDTLYSMQHWDLVDDFIYFSHSRFAIPPAGWTNAAHRNGVMVYGTFITEWALGVIDTLQLLYGPKWSPETCPRRVAGQDRNGKDVIALGSSLPFDPYYADKMVEMAVYYGFDGWFINIESELIEKNHAWMMLLFLDHLTKSLRARIPHAKVMWYDSLTIDALLRWQDHLTPLNKPFFDVSSSIFINYTWKQHHPQLSALAAGSGRRADVYTGVDVWGRGTFGGGGFNAHKALRVIKDAPTSAAIFAPGWTREHLGSRMFEQVEERFWRGVPDRLDPPFPPSDEPPTTREDPEDLGCVAAYAGVRAAGGSRVFHTDFDRGHGEAYAVLGEVMAKGLWFNLSRQACVPARAEVGRCGAVTLKPAHKVGLFTAEDAAVDNAERPTWKIEGVEEPYSGGSVLVVRVPSTIGGDEAPTWRVPVSVTRVVATSRTTASAFVRIVRGKESATEEDPSCVVGIYAVVQTDGVAATMSWASTSTLTPAWDWAPLTLALPGPATAGAHVVEVGVLARNLGITTGRKVEIHVGAITVLSDASAEPDPDFVCVDGLELRAKAVEWADSADGGVAFEMSWVDVEGVSGLNGVDRWEVHVDGRWSGVAHVPMLWAQVEGLKRVGAGGAEVEFGVLGKKQLLAMMAGASEDASLGDGVDGDVDGGLPPTDYDGGSRGDLLLELWGQHVHELLTDPFADDVSREDLRRRLRGWVDRDRTLDRWLNRVVPEEFKTIHGHVDGDGDERAANGAESASGTVAPRLAVARPHFEVRGDGLDALGVPCLEDHEFMNASGTAIKEIVKWAAKQGSRVRCHGGRDGETCDPEEILVCYSAAAVGCAPVEGLDDPAANELLGINEDPHRGEGYIKVGAAVSYERLRRYLRDAGVWGLPCAEQDVEACFGGSDALVAQGEGKGGSLRDLIVAMEIINCHGDLMTIVDPEDMRAAVGCFGILGPVITMTVKAERIESLGAAVVQPAWMDVHAAVPSDESASSDWASFAENCSKYNAEWIWFVYQSQCYVNCWDRRTVVSANEVLALNRYPDEKVSTNLNRAKALNESLLAEPVFKLLPVDLQAKMLGTAAMTVLPTEQMTIPVSDAHNFSDLIDPARANTLMVHIRVPPSRADRSLPDLTLLSRLWWSTIDIIRTAPDSPARLHLTMRLSTGSEPPPLPPLDEDADAIANHGICTLRVRTVAGSSEPVTPRQWASLRQSLMDAWSAAADERNTPLRPGWSAEWRGLKNRFPGVTPSQSTSIPIEETSRLAAARSIRALARRVGDLGGRSGRGDAGFTYADCLLRFSTAMLRSWLAVEWPMGGDGLTLRSKRWAWRGTRNEVVAIYVRDVLEPVFVAIELLVDGKSWGAGDGRVVAGPFEEEEGASLLLEGVGTFDGLHVTVFREGQHVIFEHRMPMAASIAYAVFDRFAGGTMKTEVVVLPGIVERGSEPVIFDQHKKATSSLVYDPAAAARAREGVEVARGDDGCLLQ